MSVEYGERPELTPYELFVADLKENYDSKLLDPETIFEISPISQTGQSMASCINESEGVSQELRAVIRSGKELYPIIDATISGKTSGNKPPHLAKTTLIAKYVPGQRAEIVDVSRKRGRLDVGRGASSVPGSVPRNQFSVVQAIDRTLGVVDHFSNDGTVVYTKKTAEDSEKVRPISHELWSVKSAELKAVFETSKN
jgi:hypothetical protein